MSLKKKIKIGLLSFVGLIIILLLVAPLIIKNYLINNSKELIGRQVQLEKLKVNYFTSTVRAYDFVMFEQNEKDSFVSFDTLRVDLEPLKLFKSTLEIEDIYLSGLEATVSAKDTLFNFDDLIAFHSKETDTTTVKEGEDQVSKFIISNIRLQSSDFHYDDQNVNQVTSLKDISFFVPEIKWDQEHKSNAGIKLSIGDNGTLESKLDVHPLEGEFIAEIDVKNLHLKNFYKYVKSFANVNSFDGDVNTTLHIEGSMYDVMTSKIWGDFTLTDFNMTDSKDVSFVSAKKLYAKASEINLSESRYVIDTLLLNGAYSYVELKENSNNFSDLMTSQPTDSVQVVVEEESEEPSNLYYAIHHFKLSESNVKYTDYLTGKPFTIEMNNISMNLDSLHTETHWLHVDGDMEINHRAIVNADMTLDPSNFKNANIEVKMKRFLISDVNRYNRHYMGHSTLKGDLDFVSKTEIKDGKLRGTNDLHMKQVSMKNHKDGEYNLPLNLALFLMKDSKGNIDMEIPLKGDMNDPSTDVKSIAWKAFSRVILNVVASPARLLVNLVGGDPRDIEEIHYTYLSNELTEEHKKQLEKLVELEKKKDGIHIELSTFVNSEDQYKAIVEDKAGKLYYEKTKKNYQEETVDFEKFLRSKVKNDTMSVSSIYNQLFDKTEIDSIANLHNRAMMSKIETYLKTLNDSTKITVSEKIGQRKDSVIQLPVLLVDYSIEEIE